MQSNFCLYCFYTLHYFYLDFENKRHRAKILTFLLENWILLFLLSTENISRDFLGSMQFFMTVKQKAKNYQIDQFFLLFTHDHRKIEFKFLRQNRSKTFWLPILILVQFFKNHAYSNSSIFGAKIQKMILFSGI